MYKNETNMQIAEKIIKLCTQVLLIPANLLSVVNLKLFFLAEKKNKKQNRNYRMWCLLSAATNHCLVMIYLSWIVDNEGRK